MDLLELMKKELLRRNYSHKTILTYVYCVKRFLYACKKEPRKITKKDIQLYLENLCNDKKAASTLNVHLQSIKFALEQILNKRFFVKLPYSKVPERLPEVLTKEELLSLFSTIKNKKHLLMIQLSYSAGLRVSELVNLKVRDLEFQNNQGWVRKGKGNKDRPFILAQSLNPSLQKHICQESLQPASWLFPGRKSHLHVKTIYNIVKQAAKKSQLQKNVHPHTLRHTFATHLIENGYSVTSVQGLLAHASVETTMVYVHMATPNLLNVNSPFDEFHAEIN